MDRIKNIGSNVSVNGLAFIRGDSKVSKLVKAVLIIILIVFAISIIKKAVTGYKKYKDGSPWILKGTKDGRKRLIVLQDPGKLGSITIKRSENEYGGLEFTYMFWMNIDDWAYKYGQWKHILHKGNESSWPLRGPGVWLHPKENAMRIYMNTFKNIGEKVDIDNLPLNKWFHVAIAVRQKFLDIYVNGNIVKRHELEGLPKQNSGDLYLNAFRGFGGFLSNIRYFDYYVSFAELDSALLTGPVESGCIDSNEVPPYFTPNWWSNSSSSE
tara:strand:- start:412 stop:1218 length:807 start_codon:yes stop_codon:yes gene_type:complete